MSLTLRIALRYLFSRKSTHAINIISAISAGGVAVATMALVVTLSVFNGFHDLVQSLFTAFDPQLKIVPAAGKDAPADDPRLAKVRALPCVAVATDIVEDQALALYGGRQAMVTVMGVEDNFDQLTHIREICQGDGTYELHAADLSFGIPGMRLAETLGTGYRYDRPIQIYAPVRQGQLDPTDPEGSFVRDELYSPGVVFCVKQAKYDRAHILTDIGFARRIFDRQGMLTALALRLHPGQDFDRAKAQVAETAGPGYKVLDRYEQQEDTYRIMKVEKLIAYIFLTFILVVACFNIIGSLSMLMIEKRDDARTLRALGASTAMLRGIFLAEGRLIAAIGAALGIGLGLLLCWLQQTYGLVGLGRQSGSFIVDAYPVSVHYTDVLIIFATVLITGFAAVWYPVRHFTKD